MKTDDVPQDANETFRGYGTKAVYAVDKNGRYTKIATSGWEVEEIVLRDVLADFEQLAADAKKRTVAGKCSPIEYFMYKRFMDIPALASAMGIAKWRVKRHMKPAVFQKLDASMRKRYADLFRIDISALQHFEENAALDPDS